MGAGNGVGSELGRDGIGGVAAAMWETRGEGAREGEGALGFVG